ncbi:MAG: ATP-binding protein [Candidatus Electryonea clarkiae]|nr:ATP-binding protein [Candidatus Electryonea clarkiae]MDP8287927.1 ATP-binding protein [Candidatus Electryonea clarkiae]
MKKRYYLSMLSMYLLILTFDSVYYFVHKSFGTLAVTAIAHLVLYGFINFVGVYFLYKPIDHLFIQGKATEKAKKRIKNLAWYSSGWIFLLGSFYVFNTFTVFYLFPNDIPQFSPEKVPASFLLLNMIPSLLFMYAILPAFITYFLINDFNLDLKTKVYFQFQILYPVGKKRIGMTLLLVFIILVFIPTLFVILDLTFLSAMKNHYTEFTSLNAVGITIVDRFVVLIGMIFAAIFITRSFTKPIYSLLNNIDKLREGDFSTRAAIIAEDEIGLLTNNFNEMVQELEISHNDLEEHNRTLEDKVRERTRALEENQVKLVQSEKMASLGNLVAGVSHEINNPMGAINSTNKGTSDILERLLSIISETNTLEELRNDKKFQKYISLMQKNNEVSKLAGERITKIVQTLKNFARLDEAEFQLADIHKGIEDTLVLLHHELKYRIKVKTEFGKIPKIHCYPNQLNQVFMNITMNAIQAIDEKGEINIKTWSDETNVNIEISDNGRGIPAESLEKIFDPGFTTKSSGVGTGLGLSIVYNIIEAHKGDIKAESLPGEGSTFILRIPLNIG